MALSILAADASRFIAVMEGSGIQIMMTQRKRRGRLQPLPVHFNSMSKAEDNQVLSSVDRALLMVETVAKNGHLNVTQLAKQLETGKATAFRLAHTLVGRGWLVKGQDRCYRVGPALSALANGATARDLRVELASALEQLHGDTGETIHLTRLDGRRVTYIEQLVSTKPVLSVATIGDSSPAHCVSPGLALLAALDEERLVRFLAKPLERYTEASITDPRQLRRELALVRDRGYAVNIGGYRPDVGGVACAVLDARGDPIAGISVCVPVYRLTPERIKEFSTHVLAAARKAQQKIGSSYVRRLGPDITRTGRRSLAAT